MHPGIVAARTPGALAVHQVTTGEQRTYAELDHRSHQLSHLLHDAGLVPGDAVAVLLDNDVRYYECYWAAIRSGMYLVPVNTHLRPADIAYILADSGARAMVTTSRLGDLADEVLQHLELSMATVLETDARPGHRDYDRALDDYAGDPMPERGRGETMLYSSGTTGRPKGVRKSLTGAPWDTVTPNVAIASRLWSFDGSTRYLSPSPLYHAAPLGFSTAVQALGGTVLVSGRFDPERALQHVDELGVTHSQWVPTMFSRMLKLEEAARRRYSGETHVAAIHAAAPCPVEVKRQMLDWWGPIIHEYYAGTEMNGFVYCDPQTWLAHPGTVGRAVLGTIHICDDEGDECPVGEPGVVYFERDAVPFVYHNDPERTRNGQHPRYPTWSTLGDIGRLDNDGCLYLTDRKTFMVVSGGVNLSPQEVENELVLHESVLDAAAFGVPDPDLGERLIALVQPRDIPLDEAAYTADLMKWLSGRLAKFKLPREIHVRPELPRLPTGKLDKLGLRSDFWAGHTTPIV